MLQILKKSIAFSTLLLVLVSCKKNALEPNEQGITNGNSNQSAAKELPDSRKTLLAVDITKVDANTEFPTIYRINGLTSTPYKAKLFTGETGFYIRDICQAPGVSYAYFTYEPKNTVSDKEGIWSISMDGKQLKQLVKDFSLAAYELDVDVVNGKIYWGDGNNINNMVIWRCDLDGSNKEQVIIKGVPAVGRFAIDGQGKRIFFEYVKNMNVVVGSCDLQGNIITPIVTTIGYDPVFQMNLDVATQKLYLHLTFNGVQYASMNGVNTLTQELPLPVSNEYNGMMYDFSKPIIYYSSPTKLFSMDFQGNNKKEIISGFSNVRVLDGILK